MTHLGEDFTPADMDAGWDVPGRAFLGYRGPCLRGIGRLEDLQLIKSLQPRGPQLSAAGLHPWVWDAAASLWNTGHYRQAVSAAAGVLSAQTQARCNRDDVNDQALMSEALNPADPAPGRPRLRVAPDMDNKFGKALQQGAMNYAMGAYGSIRNPAIHGTEEWDEQEALEKLAALSVLARIIDGATVAAAGDLHLG